MNLKLACLAFGTFFTLTNPAMAGKVYSPGEALKACPHSSGKDPDTASSVLKFMSPQIASVNTVMFYGGKKTDRMANSGIKSYMADSAQSDDRFFDAAVVFLSQLRHKDDLRKKQTYAFTPIEERAEFDVHQLALKAANSDQYLAMKIMTVFGHDNMSRDLIGSKDDCRVNLLNTLIPDSNSTLYLNGAIGGQNYPAAKVAEGQQIVKNCQDPELTKIEMNLCNDLMTEYQGDYYHVDAAAFHACRASIEGRHTKSIVPTAVENKAFEMAYLAGVRQYKLDRFKEELSAVIKQNLISKPLMILLQVGMDRLESGMHPLLDPIVSFGAYKISPRDYKAAKAILHRWEFELGFRLSQHKMGLDFGLKACAGITDLKDCH